MHQILEQSNGPVLGIRLIGEVTDDDYEAFLPEAERRIAENGKLRMLFELVEFEGWSAGALWEEIRFRTAHRQDVERVAMVGDERWEAWMTKLAAPFSAADVRYFDRDASERAWRWVQRA